MVAARKVWECRNSMLHGERGPKVAAANSELSSEFAQERERGEFDLARDGKRMFRRYNNESLKALSITEKRNCLRHIRQSREVFAERATNSQQNDGQARMDSFLRQGNS